MISPLEIMKGSILLHEGKCKKVKAIGDFILFEGTKEWIGGSLINGEPLSDAWFETLDFEYDPTSHTWFKQLELANWGIEVRRSHTGDLIAFQGFSNLWQELRVVQYVHQLQGLYFYITGEHLKIPKLPK